VHCSFQRSRRVCETQETRSHLKNPDVLETKSPQKSKTRCERSDHPPRFPLTAKPTMYGSGARVRPPRTLPSHLRDRRRSSLRRGRCEPSQFLGARPDGKRTFERNRNQAFVKIQIRLVLMHKMCIPRPVRNN
jgi:hypothetical protein